jgi:anti-sigma-K factor RskA
MKLQREWRSIMIAGAALTAVLVSASDASAAQQRLECVLSDTGARLGAENRAIVVTFDEGQKTLQAQVGSRAYGFSQVSISTVSISGQTPDVSLGIDRSSFGFVWQQYGPGQPVVEFGRCRAAESSAGQ